MSSGAGRGAGAGSSSHSSAAAKKEAKLKPSARPTPLGNCQTVASFEKIRRVGQGTYGTVYKARHFATGKVVALKRVIPLHEESYGFPVTALREISVLRDLKHPCIVNMEGVVVGRKRESVFLVFDFCENDLACIIDNVSNAFSEAQVKCIMMQILEGVAYCHERFILHRDLKMSNILYSGRGNVMIADFGLARKYDLPPRAYTPKVVTLWYRAPELLFGSLQYSTGVDMWSIGCIMGELLLSAPLLPGKNELDQIKRMFQLLGAPTERLWPGFSKLPLANTLAEQRDKYRHSRLHKVFPRLSDQGIDLLQKLLAYDPAKRISAAEALVHPYFMEYPVTKERKHMPKFSESVAKGTGGGGLRRLNRPPSGELKHAQGMLSGPDDFSPSSLALQTQVLGGASTGAFSRTGSVFGDASSVTSLPRSRMSSSGVSLMSSLARDDLVSMGGAEASCESMPPPPQPSHGPAKRQRRR